MAAPSKPAVDPVVRNAKLFATYEEKLSSPDSFNTFAQKLARWVGDPRAYYPEALPRLVQILERAKYTLMTTLYIDLNSTSFNVYRQPKNNHVDDFIKLIDTVYGFIDKFPENLQQTLHALHSTTKPEIIDVDTMDIETPELFVPHTGHMSRAALSLPRTSPLSALRTPSLAHSPPAPPTATPASSLPPPAPTAMTFASPPPPYTAAAFASPPPFSSNVATSLPPDPPQPQPAAVGPASPSSKRKSDDTPAGATKPRKKKKTLNLTDLVKLDVRNAPTASSSQDSRRSITPIVPRVEQMCLDGAQDSPVSQVSQVVEGALTQMQPHEQKQKQDSDISERESIPPVVLDEAIRTTPVPATIPVQPAAPVAEADTEMEIIIQPTRPKSASPPVSVRSESVAERRVPSIPPLVTRASVNRSLSPSASASARARSTSRQPNALDSALEDSATAPSSVIPAAFPALPPSTQALSSRDHTPAGVELEEGPQQAKHGEKAPSVSNAQHGEVLETRITDARASPVVRSNSTVSMDGAAEGVKSPVELPEVGDAAKDAEIPNSVETNDDSMDVDPSAGQREDAMHIDVQEQIDVLATLSMENAPLTAPGVSVRVPLQIETPTIIDPVFLPVPELSAPQDFFKTTRQNGTKGKAKFKMSFDIDPKHFSWIDDWNSRSQKPIKDVSKTMCLSFACYKRKDLKQQNFVSVNSQWPKTSKLKVSINENMKSITLCPPLNTTPDGFVDLGRFSIQGRNTVQIEQDGDMTSYAYFLHQHHPTRAQLLKYNDELKMENEWQKTLQYLSRPLELPPSLWEQ